MGKTENIMASVFYRLHFGKRPIVAKGTYQAVKGRGFLSRLLYPAIGIPVTRGSAFEIYVNPQSGCWKRSFGRHIFKTYAQTREKTFIEKKGVVEFIFDLHVNDNKLTYELKNLRILKIKIPKKFIIHIIAECEQTDENQWHFDIRTHDPLGNTIVRYWGLAEIRDGIS